MAAIRADQGADTDCGSRRALTASQRALLTIATGLLSVALDKVTRPKLMVRPRRTTRASASAAADVTARIRYCRWTAPNPAPRREHVAKNASGFLDIEFPGLWLVLHKIVVPGPTRVRVGILARI
jgi:hypothetical protein